MRIVRHVDYRAVLAVHVPIARHLALAQRLHSDALGKPVGAASSQDGGFVRGDPLDHLRRLKVCGSVATKRAGADLTVGLRRDSERGAQEQQRETAEESKSLTNHGADRVVSD